MCMIGSEAGGTRQRAFTLMELLVVIVILAAVATLVVSNVDKSRDDMDDIAERATLQTIRDALTGSAAGPGYLADMKHVPGFTMTKLRTHDLLSPSRYPAFGKFDPVARRGWRGPYLRNVQGVANLNPNRNGRFPAASEVRFKGDATFAERGFFPDSPAYGYGEPDEVAAADLWGNPIVIQVPTAPDEATRRRYTRLVSAGPDGKLTTPLDPLAGMQGTGTAPARGDDRVLFLNRSDVYEP